jgi:hypothetical protein
MVPREGLAILARRRAQMSPLLSAPPIDYLKAHENSLLAGIRMLRGCDRTRRRRACRCAERRPCPTSSRDK